MKRQSIFLLFLWLIFSLTVGGFSVSVRAHDVSPASSSGEQVSKEEHGGAHGGHEIASWDELLMPLTFRAINFVLFGILLVILLRKPASSFLMQRRKEIEDVIKASAERKAWAEQMYADYNRRLDHIEDEMAAVKNSLREEGEQEAKQLIEHAEILAKSLSQETSLMAQAELEEFRSRLRIAIIEKAVQMTRENLQHRLNSKDHERFAGEFLREIRQAKDQVEQGVAV